jgi:hypothetical protein
MTNYAKNGTERTDSYTELQNPFVVTVIHREVLALRHVAVLMSAASFIWRSLNQHQLRVITLQHDGTVTTSRTRRAGRSFLFQTTGW